jgi:hypothetical protein
VKTSAREAGILEWLGLGRAMCRRGAMIDKLHDHIQEELKTNTRTDTVFIITAILLNLLSLGVNAALTAGGDTSGSTIAVLVTFILLVLVINAIAIIGLAKGKQTRFKLLKGLELMYSDQGVAKYYDSSILSNYNVRYVLFILAVTCTGAVAIIVPIILLIGM